MNLRRKIERFSPGYLSSIMLQDAGCRIQGEINLRKSSPMIEAHWFFHH